jgi:hypothetical protein
VYFINERDGHIQQQRFFAAPDDEVASALAEDAQGKGPVELWRGTRMVKRWEAMPASYPLQVV